MANRLAAPNLFAGLTTALAANLDANALAAQSAFNDSSLGFWNYSGTDTGSVNNYIFSCPFGVPSGLNIGMVFSFKPANTNTAGATLTVNGLAASVVRPDGTACIGGELPVGIGCSVQYDGASFRMLALPWMPVFAYFASSAADQTVSCLNASAVTVNLVITNQQTLHLTNLFSGIPINIRVSNASGSSQLFKIVATTVSGASYSNVVYKQLSTTEVSLSATGITTTSGEVLYFNGASIIGATSIVFFNAQL